MDKHWCPNQAIAWWSPTSSCIYWLFLATWGQHNRLKKGQLDDNRWFSHQKYIWNKIWFVLVVFSVSVEFRRVYVMIFKPGQLLLSRRRTSAVDLQVSADNSTFIDSLQMRRRQELVIKVIKYKDLVLYWTSSDNYIFLLHGFWRVREHLTLWIKSWVVAQSWKFGEEQCSFLQKFISLLLNQLFSRFHSNKQIICMCVSLEMSSFFVPCGSFGN